MMLILISKTISFLPPFLVNCFSLDNFLTEKWQVLFRVVNSSMQALSSLKRAESPGGHCQVVRWPETRAPLPCAVPSPGQAMSLRQLSTSSLWLLSALGGWHGDISVGMLVARSLLCMGCTISEFWQHSWHVGDSSQVGSATVTKCCRVAHPTWFRVMEYQIRISQTISLALPCFPC